MCVLHAKPVGIDRAWQRQYRGTSADIPTILLNTLPKTRGMFLVEVLLHNLNCPWSTAALQNQALRSHLVGSRFN